MLEKLQNSSKSLNTLLDGQVNDRSKVGLGYKELIPGSFINSFELLEKQDNRSDKGYHEVNPPLTGNYIPSKRDQRLIDEHFESESVDVSNVSSSAVTTVRTVDANHKGVFSIEEPKPVKNDSFSPPIIEDWVSESEEEDEPKFQKQVQPSFPKTDLVKAKDQNQSFRKPVKQVNTAKGKVVVNAVKGNGFNAVKASNQTPQLKIGTSSRRSLGEEDASKHGRNLKQWKHRRAEMKTTNQSLKEESNMILLDLSSHSTRTEVNAASVYGYYCLKSMFVEKLQLIRHKFIAPDTSTRELLKEKNSALKDMVNAMFLSPGLSHCMWRKAIISATYLLDKITYDEVVQDQRQRVDNDLQDERQDQPKEEEVEPRRCKRARTEKSIRPDFVSFMVENEPTSYREAKKMKADGTIDKYKAKLVIKGFRQREGLDFFDTYLPVTRITSIRMVLAIVALRKLEVHQMDMKMTFLNRDLENVLDMNQPESFMAPGLERKVCRLVKSLYDSRKAPNKDINFYHIIQECRLKINKDNGKTGRNTNEVITSTNKCQEGHPSFNLEDSVKREITSQHIQEWLQQP
nr:DNA-directed RNA polymerase subunit beta' [Tanacetum cinerariifolium]